MVSYLHGLLWGTGIAIRTVANPTDEAGPPRSNDEAIIAILLALGGFVLPILFPVALVLGRRAMQQGFSGAPHRGLAVTAYSIGWIGTAFWVLLILLLVVGGVIEVFGDTGGGIGGGGISGGGGPVQPAGFGS